MSDAGQDLTEPEAPAGDTGAPVENRRNRRILIVAVAALLVAGVLGTGYAVYASSAQRAPERAETIQREYAAALTQVERVHDVLEALDPEKISSKDFAIFSADLRSELETASTQLDSIESELGDMNSSSGKAAYVEGVASSRKAISALETAMSTTADVVKIVDQETAAFAADEAAGNELDAAYSTDNYVKSKARALAAKKMLPQVISAWAALEALNGAQNSPQEGYKVNRQLAELLMQQADLVARMAETEDYDKLDALSKKSDAVMDQGDALIAQLEDVDDDWAAGTKNDALKPATEAILKAKLAQAKGEEAFRE